MGKWFKGHSDWVHPWILLKYDFEEERVDAWNKKGYHTRTMVTRKEKEKRVCKITGTWKEIGEDEGLRIIVLLKLGHCVGG